MFGSFLPSERASELTIDCTNERRIGTNARSKETNELTSERINDMNEETKRRRRKEQTSERMN